MASKRKASKAGLSATRDGTNSKKSNRGGDPEVVSKFFSALISALKIFLSPADLAPFESLPDKSAYPDYYTAIALPISLSDIQSKHADGAYHSTQQILHDFDLLCSNAQAYNTRGSSIFLTSLKLFSFVHKFELLRKIPSQYRDYAASLLDMEARVLNEVQYYKPRIKNSRFMCDPFVEVPSRKEYPDYYKVIKSPTSIIHVKTALWHGKFLEPTSFRDALVLIFQNAQQYNAPESTIYSDSVALQKTSIMRFDRSLKQFEENNSPPEGFQDWATKFDYAAAKDYPDEEDSGDTSEATIPVVGSSNGAPKARTTRSTADQQQQQQQQPPKQQPNGNSGLKIKLKPGSASPPLPKRIKLKASEQEPTEPSSEQQEDQSPSSHPSSSTSPQSSPKPAPSSHRIKISLRSSSKSKEDAEHVSQKDLKPSPKITISTSKQQKNASSPVNNKQENNLPAVNAATTPAASTTATTAKSVSPAKSSKHSNTKDLTQSSPTINQQPQKKQSTQPQLQTTDTKVTTPPLPRKRGRPRTVTAERTPENAARLSKSAVATATATTTSTLKNSTATSSILSSSSSSSSSLSISAVPSEANASSTQTLALAHTPPVDLSYLSSLPNGALLPSGTSLASSDKALLEEPLPETTVNYRSIRRSKDEPVSSALIKYISFSSLVPSISKYHQSKNPIPPMQQLSMFQIHFPVSEHFRERAFAFWVPYFHHTFSLVTLLNESLNHRHHLIVLTHNGTLVQPYKSSTTSLWADPNTPITSRFEVRLATGLNLLEFVVSASAESAGNARSSGSSNNNGSGDGSGESGDSTDNSGGGPSNNGSVGGPISKAGKRALTAALNNISGGLSATGGTTSGANSGTTTPLMLPSSRHQSVDPHEEMITERLSLWITMGQSP